MQLFFKHGLALNTVFGCLGNDKKSGKPSN